MSILNSKKIQAAALTYFLAAARSLMFEAVLLLCYYCCKTGRCKLEVLILVGRGSFCAATNSVTRPRPPTGCFNTIITLVILLSLAPNTSKKTDIKPTHDDILSPDNALYIFLNNGYGFCRQAYGLYSFFPTMLEFQSCC